MSKTKAQSVAESIKALKQGGQADSLKKEAPIKTGKRGGAREGSGRKTKETTLIARGIRDWVDSHINEEDTIAIVDRRTGTRVEVKKPRVVAVLEKLYQIGMKGEGDADALNKWLDRALGKAVQPIAGDQDKPILLKLDF